MDALIKLWVLKLKGNIRNVFSKPSSAIFAILIILLYGGLFIFSLTSGDQSLSMSNFVSINMVILLIIVFNAFFIFTMLAQKRKALLFENDSFYLFTGPFKQSQVMKYLMSNQLISAFMLSSISLIMIVIFGNELSFDVGFLVLVFFSIALLNLFFVIMIDYLYILSMGDERYKKVPKYVIGTYVILVLVIFVWILAQNNFDIKNGAMLFLESDLFYIVPMFGWVKLVLISYVANDVLALCIGILLLITSSSIIYWLMASYKGDFVEQAMQDAQEFTAYYREIKAGNRTSINDKKVKNITGEFKEGAAAILSKNILMLRKTNDFFRIQDVMTLSIYLIITLFTDLGFLFFLYMMIFWLFSSIQNSDFMKDMNNYQIYLIPDSGWKKLVYVILPTFFKTVILLSVAMVISSFIFQLNVLDALQYYIMLIGYASLFISGTVLSLRILKSRNNAIMENAMRMLICALASLPSILLIIYIMNSQNFSALSMITTMSLISLGLNFLISIVIIWLCKGMMDGREIKSE